MLSSEIESLIENLAALGRPVVDWLLPGSSSARISQILGPDIPSEMETWFSWCDGAEVHDGQTVEDVYIIPGYHPLSLSEAVEIKHFYGDDPVLGHHWIPFLGGDGGDFHAAVWGVERKAVVAGVVIGEPTEIEFTSLGKLMSFFNECYRREFITVDSQVQMAVDLDSSEDLYATFCL